MLSFPVLKRGMLGEGSSVRKVCPESSGALKGVLGKNLYVVSEKDVFIHCCFALTLQLL